MTALNSSLGTFHNIARALIVDNGYILLAQASGANNTFLPGGHIEFGESAQQTIEREISEEIGYACIVGDFAGAVEHTWPQQNKQNHEINLVFNTRIIGLEPRDNPQSKEPHLQLFWVKLAELDKHNLQPGPLCKWLQEHPTPTGRWASTTIP